MDEDNVLEIDATNGLLANDSDSDGDTLTVTLVTGPAHGTLELNADGSFKYTPDADFYGTDTFTYAAVDGAINPSEATVTITVAAIADAPVAEADAYAVDEDGTLTLDAASGVLVNDSDADGDSIEAVLVSGPTNGTFTLNSDGSFTYEPNDNFNGTDSFTYYITDGTLTSSTTTVTITVNSVDDAPVAGTESYTVDEDDTLTIDAANGVLANDSDIDGDSLEAVLVDGPANGSLTLNSDGSFTYEPSDDFNGTDTFTYYVTDGTLTSATTTVTITVNSVVDAPVAGTDSYTVNEDNTLTVDAANGVLSNDTDADGDSIEAVLVDGPSNGSLTLNSDGSFTYEPSDDFNGTDSFTYYVTDGTLTSSTTTVTITVNSVNDAPTAGADTYTVDEDNTLTVDAANGVLLNDSDADGDSIEAVLVSGPTNGSLTLNTDGSFTYEPNDDFNGTDSFTYYATDDNLHSAVTTVSITINSVNDSPVATADEVTLSSVAATDIDVLDNDTDSDTSDTLSIDSFDSTSTAGATITLNSNGTLHYDPTTSTTLTNGTVTSDSFTYTLTDGHTDVAVTGTVTVSFSADTGTTYITFNGDSINVSGSNATVDGTTVTLTSARTYSLSGTLNDGQVIVDTDDEEDVVIILNGVNITCSDSAPIYVVNATDTVITLADNTENYITDGDTYTYEAGVDEPDAAIYSNDDLVINGSGSLTVDANYNDGIASTDDLDIDSGTIKVTAVNHGIRGKDSVVILDGTITVEAGNDGIQSDNDEDDSKGYVSIEGGTLDITADSDGIQAETTITISGGDVTISADSKGLKAETGITIEAGTVDGVSVDVDSTDDAIHTSGTVTISDGDITLATDDDAISADTSVTLSGGNIEITACYEGVESPTITIDGATIDITSSNDGISGSSEDGSSGVVSIYSGTVAIDAGADGIQSEAELLISNGTVNITTGGGSTATLSSDTSAKALKADGDIIVTGGTITIDSADDAIHSNDTVTISGGDITITSGDDGIHADNSITIDGGEIDITKSYEGIESTVVTIEDGTIHLVSSDDGINIAGGNDSSGNPFAVDSSAYFELSGGYIFVNAQGDGCDSNGSVYMSGGTMIINGPTDSMNGALDYNGTFEVTGGYLLAVGSAGMAESTSSTSTQETMAYSYGSTQSAGLMIHIETESGEEILTFVPTKTYQAVVLCSADLEVGTTYVVYSGGSSTGTETDGLYSGGTYTAGTELGEITIS